MTRPDVSSANSALFLTPEIPVMGTGGGGLRSASVLEYLKSRYDARVASFDLPEHSKGTVARAVRNAGRLARGVPPLFDRFSGCEAQLEPFFDRRYRVAVVEHFWCAQYADVLRPHCDLLVLDLHNIESRLAETHASATSGVESIAFSRFAEAYRKLEREWIPKFDLVLAASEADRSLVDHPSVHVFPNALPETPQPNVPEENCIVFSGNLEYHPNVEAVRWFAAEIWPKLRERFSGEWRLVGRNPEAIEKLVKDDPRVRVVGPVEDAIAELVRAKVCVVPLLSGSGTRFKILEAWAAGRAVVSTTIGAEGLDARDGEHLLIADTPDDFVSKAERLLASEELRQQLGTAGRRYFEQQFTWKVAWQALAKAGI